MSLFDPVLDGLLGDPSLDIATIDALVAKRFPTATPIVWECDARTFAFSFVSRAAEDLLGYPVARWRESGFWAEHIVLREDQDDAVSYCTLATGKARDHVFEYRARASDGRLVWLCDYVKVVVDARGQAARLRGAMVDVTGDKVTLVSPTLLQSPTRQELLALPD